MKITELIHNGLYLIAGRAVKYNAMFKDFSALGSTKAWYLNLEDTWNNGEVCVYSAKVMPMPLTEEILKANGFKYNANTKEEECENAVMSANYPKHFFVLENGKYVVVLNQNRFEGERDSGNFVDSIFGGNSALYDISINYTHELQQALRLCGLNELADNLKLTEE